MSPEYYAYIGSAALIFLTVIILKWKALLDFLLPPQSRYQLAFRLQDQVNEASWNAITSLQDLVTLQPQYRQSAGAILLKLGTHESMVNFLVNSLTEAAAVTAKSGPLSFNFCKNLMAIKEKKLLPDTTVNPLLFSSWTLLRNKYFEVAYNNTLESCKAFKKTVEMLNSSCAAPLEDLTPYTDPTTGCLNSEKFLVDFKHQMDSNFKLLDSLDPLSRCRAHLNFLMAVLGDGLDDKDVSFLDATHHLDKPNLKKILFVELKDLMDLLMNLSENLQSQIIFCTDSLSDIQLDCFTHPKIFSYFSEHKDTLKQFFDNHITYPATLINISQLATTTIQIRNEAELTRVRSQYEQFLSLYNRIIKMTPKEWPTKLRNLSTPSGFPLLVVASQKEFYAILTAYADYTKRLELTKKNWSMGLRVIFGAMAVMGNTQQPAANR